MAFKIKSYQWYNSELKKKYTYSEWGWLLLVVAIITLLRFVEGSMVYVAICFVGVIGLLWYGAKIKKQDVTLRREHEKRRKTI